MSDVMLFGVLRMPFGMAMSSELSRFQFWQVAQEAADEIERLRALSAQPPAFVSHECTPTGLASHKAPLLSDNAKPPADDWQHLKRYGYAPGNYMGKCRSCNEIVHSIDKRAICCRPCAEKRHASQPPAPSVPPVRERLTETQIDSASPVRIESAHWFKLGARWAERALIGGEG